MSTDTHTPGPWAVDNQYIHGPDGIRFLAVAGDGAGQANARLIASAPELLAVLEGLFVTDSIRQTTSSASAAAVVAARSALAKATAK